MFRKGFIFINLFFCLVQFTAFGQKDNAGTVEVKPVGGNVRLDGHQIFYTLPLNVVVVDLKIIKTVTVKGPYADFAAKQMNITSGIISADAVEYSIDDISMQRYSCADSSNRYAIQYLGIDNLPEIQLTSDGCILACNSNEIKTGYPVIPLNKFFVDEEEEYPFYDLGTRPFFQTEEGSGPVIASDSSSTKKSHTQESMIPKTIEQNAADAANFIRKIRKRRLKLLASLYQESNAVEGDALKIMVAELDKLENAYVELFTGKTIKKTYQASLTFTPSEGQEAEQVTIGWFSKSQGLVSQKSDIRRNDFKPILVKMESISNLPKITLQTNDNSSKNPVSLRYGLYYRMPAIVDVTLECPEKGVLKQPMTIAQKGIIVPLPSEYLLNRKFSILFDAETGSLAKITINKD